MQQPIIIEKNTQNLAAIDLASKLFQSRIILLDGYVTEELASIVNAQLLYLKSKSSEPITIHISSYGGSIYAGLGMYDTIQDAKKTCIVKTVGIGCVASMGTTLLSAGTKGYRSVTPNTTVMIHQPSGGDYGTVSDVKITLLEMERLKALTGKLLVQDTGNPDIESKMDRDCWLDAQGALDLGIIDKIQ
jgi:ATP-dependent Clp protease protease subunit